MLKLINSRRELKFSQLMEVYLEGNLENGAEYYPALSKQEQLIHAEQDFYAYLAEFFRTAGAFYAVWEENGRYLSALRMEPYRDGLLLEALETVLDYRRQGYGKKLILAALEALSRENSVAVYSHVDKQNYPSLAIHAACGFSRISENAVYIDGSVTERSCTLRWLPQSSGTE